MDMNKIFINGLALLFGAGVSFTSCVDTDSSLVDFGPRLDSPNDTVYSFLGILNKMQGIADRTVILGEVRGDLVALTSSATTDLQELAAFRAGTDNRYNSPSDYYAVIQNCNYYIAHADTTLSMRGEKVFIREYAAVKAYRAWTYLQLAIHYGKVPFFTQPLMTEIEADPSLYPKYGMEEICNYFIEDLAPYVETDFPQLGSSFNNYFIPVRALLGDLCLWAGRYREAATYYHDFLTHVDNPRPLGQNSVSWNNKDFQSISDGWVGMIYSSSSRLACIPMESSEYDGIVSGLDDIFMSTQDNKYYYQADGSAALAELSAAQRYVMVYTDPATQLPDTISPADMTIDYADDRQKGDLRYFRTLQTTNSAGTDGFSERFLSNRKVSVSEIMTYRVASLYLRMAEAYNRAGLPESAFAILKYGLYTDMINEHISATERSRAGNLLNWSQYEFDETNTQGVHANGCGDTEADTLYVIPEGLADLNDSIRFVEDKICDEMALELSFEGMRFGDLQRMALHRGEPEFLARKIAGRNGESGFDTELYGRLCDKNNWYLPLE